jgi:pimeloyl-ACP methyl ester carboxylesterase
MPSWLGVALKRSLFLPAASIALNGAKADTPGCDAAMTSKRRNQVTDLRGVSRMAIDATTGLTDLVEALHTRIAGAPAGLGGPVVTGALNGITGLVYKSIRGVTRAVGGGIDAVLAQLGPMLGEMGSPPAREALVAALNGVLGDYLAETGNPLAIAMQLRRDGKPLELTQEGLAAAIPLPSGKVVVLVHGLCMNDLQWERKGHEHGAALARDLLFTPIYLHYNTGLHTSTNGQAFATMLDALVAAWPVPLEELVIVAHSMGGLVARSAHYTGTAATHDWPRKLCKLVFLGTPHHGAPLERGGHWIHLLLEKTPFTAPFARLGKIRSAGITDLRHGSVLDEDWQGRNRFAYGEDPRRPVPLPEGVRCYAIAATTGKSAGGLGARLLGDGLVPLASALGRHDDPRFALAFPEPNQWIAYDTGHLDLLSQPAVYERIRNWLVG